MEFVDFFSMNEKSEEKKEKKEKPQQTDVQSKEIKIEAKEESKQESEKAKVEEPKEVKKDNEHAKHKETSSLGFEYPFSLYTEGHTVDISNYGFEEGKTYTSKQICDIMLKHRHYEFAGDMTFNLFEDDNMLVATAKQYKKG